MAPEGGKTAVPSRTDREFKLLLEAIREYAIFTLDPEGRIADWNSGAYLMTGYRPSEVIGRSVAILYPAAAISGGQPDRDLQQARATGSASEDAERIRKDGSSLWVEWCISSAPAADGEPGFAVVARDISQRKADHESLRRHVRRYRTLAASMSEIVWTAHPNGMSQGEHDEWERFTGQSLEETAGFGWLEAIHPGDRARIAAAWTTAVAQQAPLEAEFRVRRADGVWRMMTARGIPIRDDTGQVLEWVGICKDVTQS